MKKLSALLGVLVVSLTLCEVAPSYAQTPLGAAVPIEDPSGDNLRRLRAALARTQRGEQSTRLVFWGASHTASDQYTAFLRQRLQRRFGDGGLGLVLPAQPFSLQEHRWVTREGGAPWRGIFVRGRSREATEYGRAGFAVETSAASHARIALPPSTRASHVELWGLAVPGGGRAELRAGRDVVATLDASSGTRTLRYASADLTQRPSSLSVQTDGSGPVRVFGVLVETADPGVVVEAFGVPGARARDQLPWDEATFAAHLARRPPDLVTIAYGTNESGDRRSLAETERELGQVLARLRRHAPQAGCLVIGPSDWPRRVAGELRVRPRTLEMVTLYRRAAFASGCAFFDLLAFQGGPLGIARFVQHDPPWALSDHVHMTDEAHARLAEVLDAALTGPRD